jgi:hypothetical protein
VAITAVALTEDATALKASFAFNSSSSTGWILLALADAVRPV